MTAVAPRATVRLPPPESKGPQGRHNDHRPILQYLPRTVLTSRTSEESQACFPFQSNFSEILQRACARSPLRIGISFRTLPNEIFPSCTGPPPPPCFNDSGRGMHPNAKSAAPGFGSACSSNWRTAE
jgi:hypothetical protein